MIGEPARAKPSGQEERTFVTTPIVTFDGIEKSYGQTVALRGVSFDVQAGEIFGLLGPNGAGKSTLIRILMDIIRADKGRVLVFGEPRRRDHLDRLGYLPEERGLYTKLPVIDVMTYFGALKGLSRQEARQRSLAWLEKVELPHVASWRVDRLSKGMSQKVQIASILLSDPEVCVLDEPTTGLDPVNVQIVEDLLLERRRNGRTTILSTHHMNQVEALCDRVALINQGQLMVYGGVDEVRRRYSLPEVRVHARGPMPAIAAVARVTDEGDWPLPAAAVRRRAAARSAGGARRAGRSSRAVRAAAGADGRHLRSRRAGGTGMNGWQKIKTVATFEFLSTVKRPGYLIATFGMPLFMAAYGGVVAIPAYFAEKSSRAARRATAWSIRRACCASRAISRAAMGRAIPEEMRRALEAAGQAEALDRAIMSRALRVPAGRDRGGGTPRARRAPAEGLSSSFRRTT